MLFIFSLTFQKLTPSLKFHGTTETEAVCTSNCVLNPQKCCQHFPSNYSQLKLLKSAVETKFLQKLTTNSLTATTKNQSTSLKDITKRNPRNHPFWNDKMISIEIPNSRNSFHREIKNKSEKVKIKLLDQTKAVPFSSVFSMFFIKISRNIRWVDKNNKH